MNESVHACAHCGALVTRSAAIEEGERLFCCSGCAGAAAIVREGGLEAWYERRTGPARRPSAFDGTTFDSPAYQAQHVRSVTEGEAETEVQVEGISCAACTWLVERSLESLPGVSSCRVSYGTGRATIRWNPEALALSQVAERIAALGYRPRAAREARRLDPDLVARTGVAVFAAMNTMTLSFANYAGWFDGIEPLWASAFRWGALLLATPAALWSAAPFFRRAWEGLRVRVVHMDLPIALGVGILYAHGLVATLQGEEGYLDSMAMLVALLLAGRVAEAVGRQRAEEAENAILAEAPGSARRLCADGTSEAISADRIGIGDRLLLATGAAVPADGRVVEGRVRVDASLVTGESEPVAVDVGGEVRAGMSVVGGSAVMVVDAATRDTLLAAMARRVTAGRQHRTRHAVLADRIAPWFTGATLAIAALAGGAWWFAAGSEAALPVVIAILVVACPCALSLGISATYAAGLAAAARRGAFVRDGDVFEHLAAATRLLLDKTGTLTEGRPRVTDASDEALALASGLERASTHPVARAILDAAAERGIPIRAGHATEELPGEGIRGDVDGHRVELRADGRGAIALHVDGELRETIRVRDRVRPEARAALAAIHLPAHVLTGDAADAAAEVSRALDGVAWTPRLSPQTKADLVAQQTSAGERVVFVGDGLNDAPAIAAASVGVAMASGASASVLAADVVIVGRGMDAVADLFAVADETRRTLLRIRTVSLIYNGAAVTAAAFGLVNPLVAALLMPASSLSVVAIALGVDARVRRRSPRRAPHEDSLPLDSSLDSARGSVRLRVHPSGA